MKGLLLKDILVLRKYMRMLGILALAYLAIGWFANQMAFLAGMAGMFGILLLMTSFGYDQQAKWDRYGAALPVGRREMVKAKYLLTFGMSLAGSLLATVMMVFYRFVNGGSWLLTLGVVCATLLFGFWAGIFLLPLIYKLGIEKSRIATIGLIIIPVTLMSLLARSGISIPPWVGRVFPAASVVVTAVAVLLSYRISCHIFQKKEL